MSNDNKHSQNEPKLELALGAPNATVPSHIRSSRLLPRVISIAAIVAWIVVFYAGTTALEKREKSLALASQALVNTGTTYIGVFSGSDKGCIGFLKADINDEQNITINSEGSFRLKLGALNYSVDMHAEVKFNDYNGLTDFEFEASIADGRIRAIKTLDENPTLILVVELGGKRQQQEIPFPHPVFLVERSPGIYAISLPTGASKQFRSFTKQHNMLGTALGLKARALTLEQASQCKADLNDASSASSVPAIEIGKYLRLLNFKVNEHPSEKDDELSSNTN